MKKFTIKDTFPFSRDEVYATQRDHLAELSAYLDDIDEIVVESREEEGDIVRFVNFWKAAPTEIPKLARPFIKPEMLQWHDYATWDASEFSCAWEMKLGFLPDAIEARGLNHWKQLGEGRTLVVIDGSITIHADRIPGIPRMMAGKAGDVIESFVVKMIEPNLKKTNLGVTQYLREHR